MTQRSGDTTSACSHVATPARNNSHYRLSSSLCNKEKNNKVFITKQQTKLTSPDFVSDRQTMN